MLKKINQLIEQILNRESVLEIRVLCTWDNVLDWFIFERKQTSLLYSKDNQSPKSLILPCFQCHRVEEKIYQLIKQILDRNSVLEIRVLCTWDNVLDRFYLKENKRVCFIPKIINLLNL